MNSDITKAQTEVYFKGSFCSFRKKQTQIHFGNSTGRGVKVAVIDSGWNMNLVDSHIKKGIGLVDPTDELSLQKNDNYGDENGHGTAVTDLILRIAPDVTIYPVKVFGRRLETSVNILIEAILWCINNDIKLINLSLGTLLDNALELLYKACEIARQKGMIIISAKSNSEIYSYPSIFENSIGVENGDFDDIFEFKYITDEATECIAKGVHNDLCFLTEERQKLGGNSFAAPVITGFLALFCESNLGTDLEMGRNLLENYSRFIAKTNTEIKSPVQ